MTVQDIINYVRILVATKGGSLSRWTDANLTLMCSEEVKSLVGRLYFPQSRVFMANAPNQQEFPIPEVFRIDQVYVNGIIAVEKVGNIDTLEGRQVLFDDNTGQGGGLAPVYARGFVQVSGPYTPGDVLTTTVGGYPVAYTVQSTDTTDVGVSMNIATALMDNANVAALISANQNTGTPGQVNLAAVQAGPPGNLITLTVSKSVGATESFISSSGFSGGADTGSGAALNSIGQGLPQWAIQTPVAPPFLQTNRPVSQNGPWTRGQRRAWYRRGGSIGFVPPLAGGESVELRCVRVPNDLVNTTDTIVVPSNFKKAISWGMCVVAFIADGSETSLPRVQIATQEREKEAALLQTWMRQYGLSDPSLEPGPTYRQFYQFGQHRA